MMTIGNLSKATGVKIPTIRYYEQSGLLPYAERSDGNQRRYTKEAKDRLTFIKHSRDLGLSIEAIRALIMLSQHPNKPCADADRIAVEQLAAVRDKITKLKKLENELERITSHQHVNQIRDCYVIRALASHDLCTSDHD
jgi:DNA-binding transcriptional MerR regulator